MSETITVCCKLPAGIHLPAVAKMPEDFVPPVLRGAYTHPSFNKYTGARDSIAFGKTEVDADYWKAFTEQYANWAPLKRGMIFSAEKPADVKAKAREAEGKKTGFEGADVTAKGTGVQKAVLK